MYTKHIKMFGRPVTLACDGNCGKAWGIQARPREHFNPEDDDDDAMLADHELGDAPARSGNTEGDCDKPDGPHEMNRWCSRQCERSVLVDPGAPIELLDFTRRRYNKPWLHAEEIARDIAAQAITRAKTECAP